jgi:hypothetical protein
MPLSAIILTVAILFGVLSSDLGRRVITTHRLIRPLLVAGGAGALYLAGFATSGAGLALELAGVGAGALLGLLAASRMQIEHDSATGRTSTLAGAGYALVWIVVAAARLAFIYGSQHWFSAGLDSWSIAHHVTADALTDSLIVMALAMTSARTFSLIVRAHAVRARCPQLADASVA